MHPNRKLLIVDDDPAIRAAWQRHLGARHHVDVAATLAEARALLASRPYDLVILDLRLRRESGTDLLAELDPFTAVLVVSGDFDETTFRTSTAPTPPWTSTATPASTSCGRAS
jgi:DNA-binding response OmpR family regulator